MNNQKSRDPEPEVTLPEVDGFSTNHVLTEYVYLHRKPQNKVRRKKKGREMLSHELETDACAERSPKMANIHEQGLETERFLVNKHRKSMAAVPK